MASKLELQFHSAGVKGQSFTVFTGAQYSFVNKRTGLRQVAISDRVTTAENFLSAFNTDENYLNQFTTDITFELTTVDDGFGNQIPGEAIATVILEHPDNNKFNSYLNGTTFISVNLTTTVQEDASTLNLVLGASATDICGKFNLNIQSNVTGGRVTVELPTGNKILDVPTSSLPYDLDWPRPAVATSGAVNLFSNTTSTTPVKTVFFTAPAVLVVSSVDVQGTPFGAAIQIQSNGTNLQYSLDNVDFQGSKEYTGIPSGDYTAYVKDAYGCVKSLAFTVTVEDTQGLTVPPLIKFPIHNSIRFSDRDGDTFLNFLATETPSFLNIKNYFQNYLLGDVVRLQFKSSYTTNRVFAYDCDTETEIAVVKKSDNISRSNIYQGNYANYDNRLAVYFTSGNVYNADNSVKSTHELNGLLPDWYEEGTYINIEGVGPTVIDRIIFDEDTEIRYAVTLKSGLGTVLDKKITSIHTAHPYEVYEFELNFLTQGKYIFKLDYGAGIMLSEPVKVHSELPDKYLKVEWFSDYNNDILYGTGIRQFRRLEWAKYFTYLDKHEKEAFYADTTLGLVNSKSHSTYEIVFMPMPMEMARGLSFGFNSAGSRVIVNGAVFVCDGAFKAEPFGSMYKVTAELTLTDQTMKGQQAVNDAVNAEFLIVQQDVNGVKFLRL